MSIFGGKEKEQNSLEEKFTFPHASEDQVNQSTLAKDIQIHGSVEAKDYINFDGSITGTIKAKTVNLGRSSYVKGSVTADQITCLLYTSPSPRDISGSRMPSSA